MRAWVEIDTQALRYNIKKIQEMSAPLEVLGIVKTNAYGLGAVSIAKILEEEGIHFFGVACLQEAIELQENGIKGNILIIGSLFHEEIIEAEKRGFHICVASIEELHWILEHAPSTKIHLKIDTGMTRLGISYQKGIEAIEFAKSKALKIQGVFSHFSDADSLSEAAKKYTETQMQRFLVYSEREDIPYRHIFNSGAIIHYTNQKIGNMARAGICMYGMLGNQRIPKFKNVVSLKTKILFTKRVEEDSYVSYGRKYQLKAGQSYATLAIGYGDGVKRYFSEGGKVEVLGVKCPIIGSICMDMMMIKLTKEIEEKIKVGMEVTVFNNRILEENQIEEACTWDIFTGMGNRVQRIYKK